METFCLRIRSKILVVGSIYTIDSFNEILYLHWRCIWDDDNIWSVISHESGPPHSIPVQFLCSSVNTNFSTGTNNCCVNTNFCPLDLLDLIQAHRRKIFHLNITIHLQSLLKSNEVKTFLLAKYALMAPCSWATSSLILSSRISSIRPRIPSMKV